MDDALPKDFYNKIIELCQQTPEKKTELIELFGSSLWTCLDHILTDLIISTRSQSELERSTKLEEIFKTFTKSLEVFGSEEPNLLNCLGVALNKLEKPIDAINYLEKAIKLRPKEIAFLENRDNVINQWVPRWHFIMLNDCERNSAYKKAIFNKIKKENCKTILDIGTGTGLLSQYCFEAGVKNIYACEVDEIMSDIAKQVFTQNQNPTILIPKHSTKIQPTTDSVPQFDLIVTEIFDSGVFGEDCLTTMIHAKKNLLLENGHLIPSKIRMFVCGVNSIGGLEKYQNVQSTMENSIYLKNTILIPETDSPYEPFEMINSNLKLCTEKKDAFNVNLNDLDSLEKALDGSLDAKVKLGSLDDDYLEGFLVYFELYLDDENKLCNFNEDGKLKCWDPIIFPLIKPIEIRKYQILTIELSCKNGILNLTHEYDDNSAMRKLKISQEIFNFLCDDEFILDLEYNVNKTLKKNCKNLTVGDFLTFPHIGINLLKENKIMKLYCLDSVKQLVEQIAEWNLIPLEKFEFIEDFDSLGMSTKFDLILLQPINNDGLLHQSQLKYYGHLKSNLLQPNGIIFPNKIDITFKLIYSKWLEQVTEVNNSELEKMGIQNLINKYKTNHQFDFIHYDFSELSENFTTTINFSPELFEKNFMINLKTSAEENSENNSKKINGILYYYKIYFMKNSFIETNRKKSFCKVNCFVESQHQVTQSHVKVNFIQNEYLFRCKIFK